jgi:hypothetical protein
MNDDIEAISAAMDKANDWYERAGKHPRRLDDGLWRWILPEPGVEDATSDLPQEVFNLLRSNERHPWLYQTRIEAEVMARTAAGRAIIAGWQPKEISYEAW